MLGISNWNLNKTSLGLEIYFGIQLHKALLL
jgi:hypothetical protein